MEFDYDLLADPEMLLRSWMVAHEALEHVIIESGRPWTDVGLEIMNAEFRMVLAEAGEEL